MRVAGPVLAVRKVDTVGVDVGSRKVSVGVPFRKALDNGQGEIHAGVRAWIRSILSWKSVTLRISGTQ
jgi:hypothetical protein